VPHQDGGRAEARALAHFSSPPQLRWPRWRDETTCNPPPHHRCAAACRIQKELQRYHEDLQSQQAKVARMREEAADEYDIKKQVSATRCWLNE